MHYLSIMTDEQTLVMYSGHPMGLFPSSSDAPRVVITNGMVNIYIDCLYVVSILISLMFAMICTSFCYFIVVFIMKCFNLELLNCH